jgi:aerobic carbon-monoxide dehydrogenase medium subunit
MIPAQFEYHRPKNVAEAIKLLGSVKDARLLAGGHSLLPAMKLRLASPAAVIDIGRIAELRGVKSDKGVLRIGALTTHADVAASDLVRKSCPVLAETASHIGDIQVRNRGTIGGSVAHADPGADYPNVLVLLGAKFTAMGPKGEREISADHFFVDLFTTSLKPGEILTSVHVPAESAAVYLKHRHPASSFAVVGVAALLEVKDGKCARAGVVVGGVTTKPVRVTAAESALKGQAANEASFEKAAATVAAALKDHISDSYASGEFRVHLATVMTRRALAEAAGK